MLKTQVQLLTTQLTLLTEKRARKKKAKAQAAMMNPKKSKSRPKSMPASGYPSLGKSGQPGKRSLDVDSDVVQELTYDQKRELSENINILTQEQLGRVLQIIRENTHIDEVIFFPFNISRVKVKKSNWILIHSIKSPCGNYIRL